MNANRCWRVALLVFGVGLAGCSQQDSGGPRASGTSGATLPLVEVADIPLPGNSTRFDYQDVDQARGQLVVAHMDDDAVLIVSLADGSLLKQVPGVGTVRGVLAASEVGLIFASAMATNELVLIDSTSLTETGRTPTGNAPDGIGWDPIHQVVAVSDQADGAISLIANAGMGSRIDVPLGSETGNVVFDSHRDCFWASVVAAVRPDQLVSIDPVSGTVNQRIDLPGCDGAHGLRLHPSGNSAFVACEVNNVLARVDFTSTNSVSIAPTGEGPDVLSIDARLGWLYAAAESGDLVVFDISRPGATAIDHEHPADGSHSVAVDPTTHRVFFPLSVGPQGTPVLRIMKPGP